MKTYTVKHMTAYTKRMYVVAAESELEAISFCQVNESGTDCYGKLYTPSHTEFEAELINGVTSRKEGIKSKISF